MASGRGLSLSDDDLDLALTLLRGAQPEHLAHLGRTLRGQDEAALAGLARRLASSSSNPRRSTTRSSGRLGSITITCSSWAGRRRSCTSRRLRSTSTGTVSSRCTCSACSRPPRAKTDSAGSAAAAAPPARRPPRRGEASRGARAGTPAAAISPGRLRELRPRRRPPTMSWCRGWQGPGHGGLMRHGPPGASRLPEVLRRGQIVQRRPAQLGGWSTIRAGGVCPRAPSREVRSGPPRSTTRRAARSAYRLADQRCAASRCAPVRVVMVSRPSPLRGGHLQGAADLEPSGSSGQGPSLADGQGQRGLCETVIRPSSTATVSSSSTTSPPDPPQVGRTAQAATTTSLPSPAVKTGTS